MTATQAKTAPAPVDYFTQAEVFAAYKAAKGLNFAICSPDQNEAAKLTIEQAGALANWCKYQTTSLFEDRDGNGWPLEAILCIYHVSIVYEDFESWLSEDEKTARRAYKDVAQFFRIKL